MAVGNTFGATALSSYGGFWLSFAIVLTPGGFQIESTLVEISEGTFLNSFGLYLMGWFIFTFLLLICTLRSTVAFFLLFFTLDMAFLLLGIGYLQHDANGTQTGCIRAGGVFGILAAFLAWYNALAGIADSSNRSVPSFYIHLQIIRSINLHTLQLLRHPRRALPLVRQRPRKARKGQQRWRSRRLEITRPNFCACGSRSAGTCLALIVDKNNGYVRMDGWDARVAPINSKNGWMDGYPRSQCFMLCIYAVLIPFLRTFTVSFIFYLALSILQFERSSHVHSRFQIPIFSSMQGFPAFLIDDRST